VKLVTQIAITKMCREENEGKREEGEKEEQDEDTGEGGEGRVVRGGRRKGRGEIGQ
jgi:hypothetical protein